MNLEEIKAECDKHRFSEGRNVVVTSLVSSTKAV